MNNQIYLPRLSFINKILVALSACIFIFNFALSKMASLDMGALLAVSGQGILKGYIHTLITYPLVSQSFIELILNSLMLWLMGSEFEENWGRARYLKFLSTVVIGGAFFYLLISFLFFRDHIVFSFPLFGMSGIVSSLCVAYAVIYPTRIFSFMMIIPIQAKYFCWILVLLSLYQGVSSPLSIGAWGQLGAIASGFFYMLIVSNKNFKSLSSKLSSITQRSNKPKSKAKLTLVKDNEEKPPKYWH